MGIALSEEHVALAESVAGSSAKYAPVATTRAEFEDLAAGVWPACWDHFRDQGLLSLHLPDDVGGAGAGLLEAAIVLEEAARALVPGPLLPTVLASALLHRQGAAGWLPGFAAGRTGCVAGTTGGLTAEPTAEGWLISGRTDPVLGALSAEVFVLAAAAGDETVWFVLPGEGVRRHPAESVDLTRDIGRLSLDGLAVPAEARLNVRTEDVLALASVLGAAEAVGVARWCQETGLAYVKVREQFGRPVGSFQAVKHKCARLFMQVELATAAVWDALAAAADGPEQFALAAAGVTETCVQAAVDLALETVTLLGGIGYTWEHDVHLYWRRAMSLAAMLGPRPAQQARLGGLALRTRRNAVVRLDDEPPGLRAEVAEVLRNVAALGEPERRRALAEAKLVAPQYPEPYGLGVGPAGQVVIAEEFARAGLTQPSTVIGEWALPTILAHGTDDQRDRFVPPTLRGDVDWCQLFSEPGAGSDLASLATRAVPVDGGWRLNGQKVWNSNAQLADFGICLARTDPSVSKHKGLTYFIVDMHADGVDVRPLREANGGYLFNEVFLNDVFVPDDCLIGAPGEGWKLARTTLGNERVSMGTGLRGSADLIPLARAAGSDTSRELGLLTARGMALDALGRRSLLRRLSGLRPDAGASVLKVAAAAHNADVTRTIFGWHGPGAATLEGTAARGYLGAPPQLLGGGTAEIQLNVISEHVLGLPRG
jgi:alkylation response protein AidB-like acyl-CoA dehydrogenase